MILRPVPLVCAILAVSLLLIPSGLGTRDPPGSGGDSGPNPPTPHGFVGSSNDPSAVGNFSAALNRLVTLVSIAGSGLLALVWTRVALSWFSNDVSKKIQAKDRARDALVGTLLFVAAISGLAWGLAHYVLTGT